MVKFKFFVHCAGWAAGGYENTHFANSAKEAKERVAEWNKSKPGSVSLISITEISDAEFAEDFVGII
jgi:hypothetical protein